MRLVLCVVMILAAGASSARAQALQFGGKAGPNFSTLLFDPDDGSADHDKRVSSGGGGFVVLPLGKRFAVQLEALANPKGAKLIDRTENLTAKVLLRYLDLPVLLRINGPQSTSRAFHVFAGPYSAIRLNAKRELSTIGSSLVAGEKTDMRAEIERFEFGLVGGAGVDLGRYIVIDGRYAHGLTSVNTDRSDGVKIKNRMITIMAGVRLSRR